MGRRFKQELLPLAASHYIPDSKGGWYAEGPEQLGFVTDHINSFVTKVEETLDSQSRSRSVSVHVKSTNTNGSKKGNRQSASMMTSVGSIGARRAFTTRKRSSAA